MRSRVKRHVKIAIFEQNFLSMKKYISICLLAVCVFMPQMVFGWGMIGHRVIGELAQKNLTKQAATRIDQVLGHVDVAMVANWGDFVRSDDNFKGCEVWHYKDIVAGLSREDFNKEVVTKNNGELVFHVLQLIADLKKDPNNEENLKMLIHLIGDMHMPLHMGNTEDKGGNTQRLKWFGRDISLHSLWDDALIDYQKLSYTEYADYLAKKSTDTKLTFTRSMVLDWAWDTYQIAPKVYESVSETSNAYRYNFLYISLVESRLTFAGERLAAVLNYLYDK